MIGKSFQDVLLHPIRSAIVKSILSRPNASPLGEILPDLPGSTLLSIQYHLRVLEMHGIIVKDVTPEHARHFQYYIAPDNQELQDVLDQMFPELMTI